MVVFLTVLLIFGSILELLSLKNDFSVIRYHCVPSKLGCEPGEIFQVRTTVSNYGRRTIPFLKMEEIFPKEINIQGEIDHILMEQNNCLHTSVLYIRGQQKITRTIQASLPRRGAYYFEGSRLLGGDFLGVRENIRRVEQREEIVIFPSLLKENAVLRTLSGYYGDISVRRFYIEDPILVNSYRDYSGREPMRSISWTQSAKKNQLMVKEFDHTMDLSVTILLDVYLHWSEGSHIDQLEYCFSLARTIAEFLEQKKVSYRLLTNANIRSENTAYEALMKAGQGTHHFTMLLYSLGQAEGNSFANPDDLYDMAVKNYSGENAIFYVAPFENEKRNNLIKNLQSRLGSRIYPMYAAAMQEVEQNAN